MCAPCKHMCTQVAGAHAAPGCPSLDALWGPHVLLSATCAWLPGAGQAPQICTALTEDMGPWGQGQGFDVWHGRVAVCACGRCRASRVNNLPGNAGYNRHIANLPPKQRAPEAVDPRLMTEYARARAGDHGGTTWAQVGAGARSEGPGTGPGGGGPRRKGREEISVFMIPG